MAIIGIILSTSVPSLSRYAAQARLKTTTRELIGLLSLARSSAITTRSSRTVVIDSDEGHAVIQESLEEAEPRRVRLHTSIHVTVSTQGQDQEEEYEGPAQVTFQPSGSLAGRSVSVTLSSGTRSQIISITGVTGSITLKSALAEAS